jgi:hypothetical protein
MTDISIPRDALVPKWRPSIPVDLAAIADRMRYYTNGKWRFALFTNGTCALIPNAGADPVADATELVCAAGFGHVDFDPRPMDDGNLLVGFTQQVAGVVLASELSENRQYLAENVRDGVRSHEALFSGGAQSTAIDDRLKAGLLARARLFMDAESLTVVDVCEPTK